MTLYTFIFCFLLQTWTGAASHESQKASKPKRKENQRGQYSDDSPTKFTRKKHHTPATLPRTRFSSGASGAAQHRAMDKLKQQLTFSADDEVQ